jgi:hypothetical protein
MIDPRYPGLSTAIVNSVFWRGGAMVVDAFARAWPGSRTAGRVATVARLRGVSRVAFITAAASTVALAIQMAVPAYVRSGLPIMWPIAGIIVLTIIAVWAKSFERAWAHSRFARLLAISRLLR